MIVGQGKNWNIPAFWSVVLRYVAAPALAIVFSFSYPNFYLLRNNPLHVMGFGVGHVALILIFAGFIVPKWLDVFIPPSRRGEGKVDWGANVPADVEVMERNAQMEQAGRFVNVEGNDPAAGSSSGDENPKSEEPKGEALR